MRVIMFQPRFAEMVKSGEKRQTVRWRARCKPGDILSLRRWTGKAYRSPHETLRVARCARVDSVAIENAPNRGIVVSVAGRELGPQERAAFAVADGFEGFMDMVDWFIANHSLPFYGDMISWEVENG